LIDDGSSDDISAIEDIAKKNGNIKLIRNKKNLGASASRNVGIEKATGDYIAFLDSDDAFEKNKLEVQLQYMVASNANISHTSYKRKWNDEETIIHSGADEGHCERKMIYNCPIATPTVMLKTEWLRESKKLFNENAEIGEDTCFWLDILKDNNYLVGIDKPLTVVNVGDNAAAYNDEKQVVGLKTIIKYLLNSDYYSKYDYEISLLMKSYAVYVERITEDDTLVSGGPFRKLLFFMKTEGPRSASKRVIKKTLSLFKKK
jgi:glycosyltransferase involved in cell wall biosynthesis